MSFTNNPDISRDLMTFLMSFISSLETSNVVVRDLNTFLWIAISIADVVTANRNGNKTHLANGLSTFL